MPASPWEKYGGTATAAPEEDGPWKQFAAPVEEEGPWKSFQTAAPVSGFVPSAQLVESPDSVPQNRQPLPATLAQTEQIRQNRERADAAAPIQIAPQDAAALREKGGQIVVGEDGKPTVSLETGARHLQPGYTGAEAWQEINRPVVPIPRVPQQTGVLPQAGAALVNTAIPIVEFAESPLGGFTIATAAAPSIIQRAAAIGFSADMLSHVPEQVQQAFRAPTLQGKLEGGLGALAGIFLGYKSGAHGAGVKGRNVSAKAHVDQAVKSAPDEAIQIAAADEGFRKSAPELHQSVEAELANRGLSPMPVEPVPRSLPEADAAEAAGAPLTATALRETPIQPPVEVPATATAPEPIAAREGPAAAAPVPEQAAGGQPPVASPEAVPRKLQTNTAADISTGMQGMAKGVTAGLYDTLFDKLQKGDLTEAGQPSSVLQKAKPLFDAGKIRSPEEFREWYQAGQKPAIDYKARAVEVQRQEGATPALGEPVDPETLARIRQSYETLEATPRGVKGGGHVEIADVMEGAGITDPAVARPIVARLIRDGLIPEQGGDWSLSSDRTKAFGVKPVETGRPVTTMKMDVAEKAANPTMDIPDSRKYLANSDLTLRQQEQVWNTLLKQEREDRKSGKVQGGRGFPKADIDEAIESHLEAKRDKAADEKALRMAATIDTPRVRDLLQSLRGAQDSLESIQADRGKYGVQWAERNVRSRATSQKRVIRDIKDRLISEVKLHEKSAGIAAERQRPTKETITETAPAPEAKAAAELTPEQVRDQSARVEQIVQSAVESGRDRIEATNEAQRIVDSANAAGQPVNWSMVRASALREGTQKRGGGKTVSTEAPAGESRTVGETIPVEESSAVRDVSEAVAQLSPEHQAIAQEFLDGKRRVLPDEVRSALNKKLSDDWTSATAELPRPKGMKLGGQESGAITIPKFPDRKMSPLDRATTGRSAKLQKSFDEATRAQKEISKAIPNQRRQAAISVWMEADGDAAVLNGWESGAKGKAFREAAKLAQSLTPKEIAIARKAQAAFEALAVRGARFDVLKNGRDNYVPHVWEVAKGKGGFSGSGRLQQNFKFAKARTFENFAAGDAAGFIPKTLAIGKLLPAYLHEMNRVIADRQFVQDIATGTAKDGRPLVVPRGRVSEIEKDAGDKAYLVNPRAQKGIKDATGTKIEQQDYKTMEGQPALHDWRWEGKDENGNPIFMKDDLAVHPEAAKRIDSMLGKSAIREWYSEPSEGTAAVPKVIMKALDRAQSVMKREMFGLLAPFHQVQEGWHGIAHRINPFFDIPKIDMRDAAQMDAANHGLMLLPDRAAAQSYMEGVGGKGTFLTQAARWFGESKAGENLSGKAATVLADTVDGYQNYLFHEYIPGLKFKTYEAIRARNMHLYESEIKKGKLTEPDIKILSAEQTNAAYGHLNFALLDRNPTMQHIMQLGLLAPDFFEARARFVGQAMKGAVGSKVGIEQFRAIATIAAVQAGIAYALTKLGGEEWDPKHPFEVTHKGRTYTLRSVPEDLWKLGEDVVSMAKGGTRGTPFISARVNPLAQSIAQLGSGRNYRGEKVNAMDTAEELLAKYIPITARSIPGLRSLTETGRQNPISPIEQLAGSLGLKISRHSPITETYELAGEWMEKKGVPKDKGSYPVSKYQQLRYALEDGDLSKAGEELDKLKKDSTHSKVSDGFKESLNHPFTQSKAMDDEFRKSLKPADREIFDLAKRKREDIWKRFNSLR